MRFCLRDAFASLAFALALSPNADAVDLNNGRTIFQTYCIVCHGNPPAGGPELAANNPALISAAINSVPAMSFMRPLLSQSDIQDVAAYLGVLLNGPTLPADAS